MGKYKHHSGKVGGGVNLSKGKTPHDKDIKDMPLFRMGKPYSMGTSMRGPLDKHGVSQDHKMAYDRSEISRLKKDIHFDDLKKKSMGPSAYGKMKQGPLNQAKPDYIDIDGDGNKKESMKQAAKQGGAGAAAEAAAEGAGEVGKNQKLKTTIKNKKRMKKQ